MLSTYRLIPPVSVLSYNWLPCYWHAMSLFVRPQTRVHAGHVCTCTVGQRVHVRCPCSHVGCASTYAWKFEKKRLKKKISIQTFLRRHDHKTQLQACKLLWLMWNTQKAPLHLLNAGRLSLQKRIDIRIDRSKLSEGPRSRGTKGVIKIM